jgi:predicted AlkP superfamily pyrophosphatase or phosphodiesterase
MIHLETLKEIKRGRQKNEFLFPYYGKYSIAELAPTVLWLFNIPSSRAAFPPHILERLGSPEKVVVFMLDGFAFRHFEKYQKNLEFFRAFEKNGDVYPITSVFPSTTPAALTTLHTGLTPQEHGIPEWFVYFEELDAIVETLPFKRMGETERESLLRIGGTEQMLFQGTTVYEQLGAGGIKSFVFTYHEYINSTYSRSSQKGSVVVPYVSGPDLMHKLTDVWEKTKGKAYFFVYWSHIDSAAHAFGPDSNEHRETMLEFSRLATEEFFGRIKKKALKNALGIVTADHGHSNISKEKIIYLNDYIHLETAYRWGKKKTAILPTGAPHDVFLFIHRPELEKVCHFLRTELKNKAEVLQIDEAISHGLFGINKPTKKFLSRIGDLLILPYKNFHIWYRHPLNAPFNQKGTHGGLSEDEMLVPLGILSLGKW